MSDRVILGLRELQEKIKEKIEKSLPGKYWIRAETGEVKHHSAGHCYIDLIEKESSGGVTAKIQAVIWSSAFRVIKPYFVTTTGQELKRGLSILVYAAVQYSPLYGLSLVITDIDPSFTIGEQELKRQKTIMQLKEEGMIEINTTLPLPPLPRKIAVISSESAAGYRDFIKHLRENAYGFKFDITLFSAPMQGEAAPGGIIEAMEQVSLSTPSFDLLFIIRGGGAAQDLVSFDDYLLAVNIAQFPIPVITGIGHDHDFHIADMVAHTSLKTPTAAAVFLIDIFIAEEQQLIFLSRRISLSLHGRAQAELSRLQRYRDKISSAVKQRVTEQEHFLELVNKRIEAANPISVLERGFALASRNGKKITSVKEVSAGDSLLLILKDGVLDCNINAIKNEKRG